MARRPRSATVAPVTWRDGVHLTGTPIWCDARRRRDVCFVSAADRIVRAGHGQLIATPETLALLGDGPGHLAVPLRKPFTLGTLRLELIASGRGFGAASLHVDLGARRVLYAGVIGASAEVRTCDALVVAAPIGLPQEQPPPLAEAAARLVEWARTELARHRRVHVVVDSMLDGFDVAAQLAAAGLPVAASRALRVTSGPALPAPGTAPCVVIRLAKDERRTIAKDEPHVAVRAPTWPFAADRAQLLAWIDRTGAREVFVTGARAEAIVSALGRRGRVLGPPQQMTLFREAR